MDNKKIIDLINDAIIKTKTELFAVIDNLNNKIEAQNITIKELKSELRVTLIDSFTKAVTITGGKNVHTKSSFRRKVQKQKNQSQERT